MLTLKQRPSPSGNRLVLGCCHKLMQVQTVLKVWWGCCAADKRSLVAVSTGVKDSAQHRSQHCPSIVLHDLFLFPALESSEMVGVQATPAIFFKKRANKSAARKRVATPPSASDSNSDFTSSEDENGRQIKRRKKNIGIVAASTEDKPKQIVDASAEEDGNIVVRQSNADNATKRSNWFDDEHDKSHLKASVADSVSSAPDDVYRGAANYTSFIQKNPDRQTNVGPQKLNSNVRTITVTDFAPDVCKDYKQTGFCGFGDSCKFLHAREDYKQGWQLDRDWEVDTKGKKLSGRTVASANRSGKGHEDDQDDEKLLESIPFACIICKKPYSNPVVTKCGHYFCESCALKRYRKDPACAACNAGTGGTFTVAKKLNGLLDRKREREKQKGDQQNPDNQGDAD